MGPDEILFQTKRGFTVMHIAPSAITHVTNVGAYTLILTEEHGAYFLDENGAVFMMPGVPPSMHDD